MWISPKHRTESGATVPIEPFCSCLCRPGGPPWRRVTKHDFKVGAPPPPIRQPSRRLPETLKGVVQQEVQNMLEAEVIHPSSSPWNLPLVLFKRKDGTWKFYINF